MRLTRRFVVRTGVLSALVPVFERFAVPFLGASALAQTGNGEGPADWRHGLSLYGQLKYPAEFKHFDYVNPRAPKGGAVRLMAVGTFDNFNEVVAGLKGSIAAGTGMISDTLLAPALDEVSTEYGLIAEAVTHARDFSQATFRLRAAARHHDGKPITVDDVIFSMESCKKHSPRGWRPITGTSPRCSKPESARSPSSSTGRAIAKCRSSWASSMSCRDIGGRGPTRRAANATSARPRSSRRSATPLIASKTSSPAAPSFTSG